ncbi:MAG: cysteine desulfurase family protein [Gammaproteobacteria bacterium]|nr:cysteine desulfurase family protein [Gammaproteobacteria bacterium]MCY4276694.1 cysteine desulfurase family protein [Gammaproteobacteria bacterium]
MKIGNTIYFDHQATTPLDARVLEEMLPYFGDSFGNPHSNDHIVGWRASKSVDKAAEEVARMIGADRDEIIFTSGATEANNLALLGIGRRAASGSRKKILVSEIEHKCVLEACRVLHEQHGYELEYLPVHASGVLNIDELKRLISEEVLIVTVMAVNNEIGTIQDIAEISKIVRSAGALLHCDAAQAPCAMDMSKLGEQVDMLSLSAHKMHGPQGIGALYLRRPLLNEIEPLVYGGGQQGAMRSGTLPLALCVGMGIASRLIIDTILDARQSLSNLRDDFVEKLKASSCSISINGCEGKHRHPGNANLAFEGFDAQEILGALQPQLAASTGSACTTGTPETSHVLRAIGLSEREARSSIRFSLGRGTTHDEVDQAANMILNTLEKIASR